MLSESSYIGGMDTEETAQCLAELGHKTRLLIYRFLVKMGSRGIPVGDIQKELGIPNSTLSHHISRLSKVGLISQEREGRVLFCRPQIEQLQSIIDFLTAECCQGENCLEVTSCVDASRPQKD